MKIKLLVVFTLLSLAGCGQGKKAPVVNTSAEKHEMYQGFESKVIATLKTYTDKPLQKLPAIDPETSETIDGKFIDGYLALMTEGDAFDNILLLKNELQHSGYLVFIYSGYDKENMGIGIMKGTNELDILRYSRTNAYNYDLSPEDVFSKIEDYNKMMGVTLLGCGPDWIFISFKKLPADVDALAQDMYAFCPDVVDEGAGDIQELKKIIAEEKSMLFWWD